MNNKKRIIIATIRPWNIDNAHKFKKLFKTKYEIYFIFKKENLKIEDLQTFNPDHIFFLHWSWIIPKEVYSNFECIIFHPTPLPYGRGGSPLQNLIVNKIYDTKISAIKVEKDVDSGDIYLQENICIKDGSAQEIFQNMSNVIFFKMIPYILETKPTPHKQQGKISYFKRRKPEESDILTAKIISLNDFYDFIRMLDAEEYPKAFIKIGNFKISFSNIEKKENQLEGKFEVIDKNNNL